MKIPLKLFLDTELDRDLIAFFNDITATKRNRIIKEALREFISREDDLEYIKRKVDIIVSAINSGVIIKENIINKEVSESNSEIQIEEDTILNLDKLGVL